MSRDEEINEFIEKNIKLCQKTEFYDYLCNIVENISIGSSNENLIKLFESEKYIWYNSYTIIPIIIPLLIYYRKTEIIEWLAICKNLYYEKSSSRIDLLANVLKLNLSVDLIPLQWISNKSLLPSICDNFSLTVKYINEHKDALDNVIKESASWLHESSLELVEYLYDNNMLTKYDVVTVIDKFCAIGHSDNETENKMDYIINKWKPTLEDYLNLHNRMRMDYKSIKIIIRSLSDDEQHIFLNKIIEIEDRDACYYELCNQRCRDCIFYSAMKLKLTGDQLVREKLGMNGDGELYEDYIKYYNEFIIEIQRGSKTKTAQK